jgi:hypothetical protein
MRTWCWTRATSIETPYLVSSTTDDPVSSADAETFGSSAAFADGRSCRTISWSSTCSSKGPRPYSVQLNSHLLDSGRTTQDSTWCPAVMGARPPARPRKPHRARRYIVDDSYVLTCLSGRISAMTVPGRAIMIKSTSTSHTLRQAFHAGHSAPLPCSRLFDRINAP